MSRRPRLARHATSMEHGATIGPHRSRLDDRERAQCAWRAVDLAPFWQARSTPATAQAKEEDRDDRVSDRYRGGSGQSRGLVMHEAEEGEHRAGQSKGRSLHELLLDDEHADGAEHEAGEDGTTAENLEAVIAPDLAEFVETYCGGTSRAASTTKSCARRCCAIKQST
jgi:hypothetical protein